MISIALYKPDIPQNTAAIIRLSACFEMRIHIIEPCGFSLEDSRFKKVVMDYFNFSKISRYVNYINFKKKNSKSRIVLMTTKAKKYYCNFKYQDNDILLFGRESAGVPQNIHDSVDFKLKIPMNKNTRSLNVAMASAIVSAEAMKQTKFLKI